MPKAKAKKKFNYKSKIISATRRIWLYSPVRREIMAKCKTADGFFRCDGCRKLSEGVQIDHILPSVPVTGWDGWNGFIERLFVDVTGLQGLCAKCHNEKTRTEQQLRKEARAVLPKKKKEE